MQSAPLLRIGTRGSMLALAQAHLTRRLLATAHGVAEDEIEIVAMTTSGDRLTDRPLSEAGGKGLFSKEIEDALLAGRIDLGVHSAKDLATVLPGGLALAAMLEREDIRDAFVSPHAEDLAGLKRGARLGTSSIRRAAQMLRARPDLAIVPFRGNVDTRLRKLADGIADATLLAVAGLNRLGRADVIGAMLDPERFPPAPAQGAIALEIRAGDARTAHLVAPLDHPPTHASVAVERALLGALDGSCRTPIGARTVWSPGRVQLLAEILAPDGSRSERVAGEAPAADAIAMGHALGEELRARAPELVG
jgi:hydroxymethylbilane synthase